MSMSPLISSTVFAMGKIIPSGPISSTFLVAVRSFCGKLNKEGYIEVADKISKKYNIDTVAITLRKSISASDNDWSTLLYRNGKAYFSKEYHIHIVDRVGGGDSFGAGLIYALHNGFDEQQTIEYAAAASCLKQTIEMDVNLSKPSDILALVGGDGSGRVQQ